MDRLAVCRNAVRRAVLERRTDMDPDLVDDLGFEVCNRIIDLSCYKKARVVMAYVPIRNEVDVRPLIADALESGKVVVLPVVNRSDRSMQPVPINDPGDLTTGAYGIPEPPPGREPIDPALIDLCLVPGVAFDLRGNRLGYGAGYYDRFLPRLRTGAPAVAPAYELQLVPMVPAHAGDVAIDMIVTEFRVLTPAGGRGNDSS